MSLIFSRSCQYAIRAVIFLSEEQDGRAVHVKEISDALGIPHHFLGKILQVLHRDGIVLSAKGSTGGFRLGKSAHEIRLIEIVHSIDGPASMDRCILGFPRCDEDMHCPMHAEWKESKAIIMRMLSETLVDELKDGLVPALSAAEGERSGGKSGRGAGTSRTRANESKP